MDRQRVGAAFRAVRVRKLWRQRDVADRANVSSSVVSLIENGRLDEVAPRTLRRVALVLGIRIETSVRLPHGEVDRLLNAGHAALHEELARYLDGLAGWLHVPEVSFAVFGERGVIDILAYHRPTRCLLVIELKTEFVSLEDLLTSMDRRLRLAKGIARDRDWDATSVSGWVVMTESDANRRRVRSLGTVLRSAFPADGRAMRRWLRQPSGSIRALSFWANFGESTTKQRLSTRRRVRVPRAA
jgi:transcriptional regulator with XRE-family HTH domain